MNQKTKALASLIEGDIKMTQFYGRVMLTFHAGELRTVEVLPKVMDMKGIEHLLKVKTSLEKEFDIMK